MNLNKSLFYLTQFTYKPKFFFKYFKPSNFNPIFNLNRFTIIMEAHNKELLSNIFEEKSEKFSEENLKLTSEISSLTTTLNQLRSSLSSLTSEKQSLEQDHQVELQRWQSTTNHLKMIIKDSDIQKRILEKEISKSKPIFERSRKNEWKLAEMKHSIEKLNEDRLSESEALKKRVDAILKDIAREEYEKQEALKEGKICDKELLRYKKIIKDMEEEVRILKEKMNKESDIVTWCSDRSHRRDLLNNKQSRAYMKGNKITLREIISKKPCHS